MVIGGSCIGLLIVCALFVCFLFCVHVTVFATLHAPVWVSTKPAGASAVVKVITTL